MFGYTLWVSSIAEIVLLPVSCSENVVANVVDSEDDGSPHRTQLNLIEYEIPCLQRVHEGNPGKIADSEHKAKSVSSDVHRRENGWLWKFTNGVTILNLVYLVVQSISDIPSLECQYQPHRVSYTCQ